MTNIHKLTKVHLEIVVFIIITSIYNQHTTKTTNLFDKHPNKLGLSRAELSPTGGSLETSGSN